jgi:hypothetical protein
VDVTFVLELPVDLGPDVDGLLVPTPVHGFARSNGTRIFMRTRDDKSPGTLSEAFHALENYFAGLELHDGETLGLSAQSECATVAAVTVRHHTRARSFEPSAAWLTRRFEEALTSLNRFLAGLGLASRSPDIGALRRTELPSRVPVLVDDHVAEPRVNRAVLVSALQLHDFEDLRIPLIDEGAVRTAAWLFSGVRGRSAASGLFVEYAQQARRDLHDGAYQQSVLSGCIAIETLVAGALRALWQADGDSDAGVRRKLDAGFRNLLNYHLWPRIAAAAYDAGAIDAWLQECYRVRNQIAHEGFAPHHSEAFTAHESTMRLAIEIVETVRLDGRLHRFADSLLIRRPSPEELGLAYLSRLID